MILLVWNEIRVETTKRYLPIHPAMRGFTRLSRFCVLVSSAGGTEWRDKVWLHGDFVLASRVKKFTSSSAARAGLHNQPASMAPLNLFRKAHSVRLKP